jgi:hypothetical protein
MDGNVLSSRPPQQLWCAGFPRNSVRGCSPDPADFFAGKAAILINTLTNDGKFIKHKSNHFITRRIYRQASQLNQNGFYRRIVRFGWSRQLNQVDPAAPFHCDQGASI